MIILSFLFSTVAFADSTDLCKKIREKDGDDKANLCLRKQLIRTEKFWKEKRQKSLKDKVFIAGEEFRFFMDLDNKTWGYPEKPFLVKKDLIYMKKVVAKVLESLPKEVLKLLDHSFGGVGLLENFGGTGYTATILNKKENILGSFILLDPRKLIKKANEWNTWKETTPFKKGDHKLKTTIEDSLNNTIEGAIRYNFVT